MITPSAEEVEARRRGVVRRVPWVVVLVLLMAASVLTPHIGVRVATEFGRSMFPASAFFLAAQAGGPAFGQVTDVDSLAAGLNLAYFGLSFQHVGLLLGTAFCWVLVVPDVGRWVRRLALVGGWCLTIAAPGRDRRLPAHRGRRRRRLPRGRLGLLPARRAGPGRRRRAGQAPPRQHLVLEQARLERLRR